MNRKGIILGLLAASLIMTGFAARDLSSYTDKELAQMYASKRMSEKALFHFGRAIAAAPDSPEPYLDRTFFLLKLNRREEALADMDRVIALQPDKAQHYVTRGMIYSEAGETGRAKDDFAEACRLGDRSGCAFAGTDR